MLELLLSFCVIFLKRDTKSKKDENDCQWAWLVGRNRKTGK